MINYQDIQIEHILPATNRLKSLVHESINIVAISKAVKKLEFDEFKKDLKDIFFNYSYIFLNFDSEINKNKDLNVYVQNLCTFLSILLDFNNENSKFAIDESIRLILTVMDDETAINVISIVTNRKFYRRILEHPLHSYKLSGEKMKCIFNNYVASSCNFHFVGFADFSEESVHRKSGTKESDNIELIESILSSFRNTIGSDIDRVFNEDYPIPKSHLVDNSDAVFDVLTSLAKFVILDCPEAVWANKINLDENIVKNLVHVARRYKSDKCLKILTFMLTSPHVLELSSANNEKLNIVEQPRDDEEDSISDYSGLDPIELDEDYANYFNIGLFCLAFKMYTQSNDSLNHSSCTIL